MLDGQLGQLRALMKEDRRGQNMAQYVRFYSSDPIRLTAGF